MFKILTQEMQTWKQNKVQLVTTIPIYDICVIFNFSSPIVV